MTPDDFDRLVGEALDELPDWAADALENVAVLVDDEPPPEEGELFGLYDGVALTEREDGGPFEPDRITIYRGPILRAYPEPTEAREQVRISVLHEIGHHFGLDEDRLDDLGYG
jgi:predicted Zn-dependent protease with MMP-like domain